jgi:hypothetical protein
MKNVTNGIYLITERETGKMYVGLAKRRDGIEGRWAEHKKRFPQELFTYEILLPCPPETTRAELSLLEKFYIKELDCMEPNGFNRTKGGAGSTCVGPMSKEAREKISEGNKGKNKGRKLSPRSEKQKKKQSEAMKGRKKGPMPEEQKKKIAASSAGRVQSEESKRKKSEVQKGRVVPEERRKKMVEGCRLRDERKRAAKAAAIAATEALLVELETISH